MNTKVILECNAEEGAMSVEIKGNPIEALAITSAAAAELIVEITESPVKAIELARFLAEDMCEIVQRVSCSAGTKNTAAKTHEVHIRLNFDGGDDE